MFLGDLFNNCLFDSWVLMTRWPMTGYVVFLLLSGLKVLTDLLKGHKLNYIYRNIKKTASDYEDLTDVKSPKPRGSLIFEFPEEGSQRSPDLPVNCQTQGGAGAQESGELIQQ